MLSMFRACKRGERFPLPIAKDSDVGSNSLKDYKLSSNEIFL